MINYIKSEFYRSFHNRSLWIWTVVLAGLGALGAFALSAMTNGTGDSFYGNTKFYLGCIYKSMNSLIFLVFSIVSFVDNNEYKHHTIKHSIAFGIPKSTIYIGRMIVQAVICLGIYLIVNIAMVAAAYAFLPHSNTGELELLMRAGYSCFPIFLGCVALFQGLLMNLESPWAMGIGSVAFIILVPDVLALLSMKFPWLSNVTRWCYWIMTKSTYDPEAKVMRSTWDTMQGVRDCYLAGMLGVILFTVIGIAIYKRKEVK